MELKNAEIINNESLGTSKIESFLINEKSNVVFQSLKIFNVFRKVKNYEPFFVIIENKQNKLQGILLAVIQKEHSGFLGTFSSRSIILGGPIILNKNPVVLDLLLKKYNETIKRKVIYSQFRNLREFSSLEKEVFKKRGFIYEAHYDIIHELTRSVEEQWMCLHKGRRKNIRRAERMEVKFREIQNNSEFEKVYALVKDTYQRVKLPLPDKSLFIESYKNLTNSSVLKVFVAVYNDEIIATRMVLCYNALIYDWYAGTSDKHLDKYPNDFLPWKVMEWGSLNGYKTFDFGGAGKPGVPYGVRDHKLKFGGELVEHGRFEKIHCPILFQLGKIALKLYKKIR
jgi:serine/alanine adding enzyme